MSELFIGLMSGTSVDGIDAVLVDFSQPQLNLIDTHCEKMPAELRQAILSICQPGHDEINRLGELDVKLGKAFATVVNQLLEKNHLSAKQIRAIGSHGQNIRHHPERNFTLQIGDPNVIAAETGITTVADFRRRDVAHGGQGAPLAPAFHQAILGKENLNRIVLNIGGIANITLLPADKTQSVVGFDTGPGNTLLDAFAEKHLQNPYDKNGDWASQGTLNKELLSQLLNDSYFKMLPPKSTGREYFNLNWLQNYLNHFSNHLQPIDVQTTLVELTARTIIDAVNQHLPTGEILVCGGGVHNLFLMQRLRALATNHSVDSTQKLNVNPDWMEALAFAWLAKQTLDKKPSNISAVTGAKQISILGGVYYT